MLNLFVTRAVSARIPTEYGEFELVYYSNTQDEKEHLAFCMGDLSGGEDILVRMHSECLTGDIFGSLRCDCGEQLDRSMQLIAEEGQGLIAYLRQEGRGIGLVNKIRAYNLQDQGADTVEANERLGFGADMRDYSICAPMLEHLGTKRVRLMTNNPRKIDALKALGIDVVEREPIQADSNPHNVQYLSTKAGKLGHLFKAEK